MSELLLLGTSHKTAPLALRERLALTDTGVETLLAEVRAIEATKASKTPACAGSVAAVSSGCHWTPRYQPS